MSRGGHEREQRGVPIGSLISRSWRSVLEAMGKDGDRVDVEKTMAVIRDAQKHPIPIRKSLRIANQQDANNRQ